MIQIFLKFIRKYVEKKTSMKYTQILGVLSQAAWLWVNFFLSIFLYFPKTLQSIIIIGEIHNKYPGNIFLKH